MKGRSERPSKFKGFTFIKGPHEKKLTPPTLFKTNEVTFIP